MIKLIRLNSAMKMAFSIFNFKCKMTMAFFSTNLLWSTGGIQTGLSYAARWDTHRLVHTMGGFCSFFIVPLYNMDREEKNTYKAKPLSWNGTWVETGAFPWRVGGNKFFLRFPIPCPFCPCGLPLFQLRYRFISGALPCTVFNQFNTVLQRGKV